MSIQATVTWEVPISEENPSGSITIVDGYLRVTEALWRDGSTIYFRLSLWASQAMIDGQAIRNFAYEMEMPTLAEDSTNPMTNLFYGTGLELFYNFVKANYLPDAIDV
ncbi:MAG: hypothetical protein KME54_17495 [Tolypothrix brevis GSE-NOS-MK-07-07A]|jgi:hypothetical protein|nr:hypothetical protein [Tolypothrix brevis GSE-NOS-MK-07-07A]